MKITMPRGNLLATLERVAKASAASATTTVMSHILITADKGSSVRIAASDLVVALEESAPWAAVDDAGRALLPAKALLGAVGGMSGPHVTIETDKAFCAQITSGKRKFKVPGQDPGDYPPLPFEKTAAKFVVLPTESLGHALRRVHHAMHQSSTMNANGVQLEMEDGKLVSVALDGARASISRIPIDCDGGEHAFPVLVPARGVTLILDMLDNVGDSDMQHVELGRDEKNILVRVGATHMACKMASEPLASTWRAVLEMQSHTRVEGQVDRKAMLESVKALLRTEKGTSIEMNFSLSLVTLACADPSGVAADDEITATGDGEMKFFLSGESLRDALSVLHGEQVAFRVEDDYNHAVFLTGRHDHVCAIMPRSPETVRANQRGKDVGA